MRSDDDAFDSVTDDDDETENLEVLEEVSSDVPNPPNAAEASIEDESTLPDELTGRAAATDEDLTSLFRNASREHFADGFNGGSDDDENRQEQRDRDRGLTGPEGRPDVI
jgi:hypothetical protein